MELCRTVYRLTTLFPEDERFGLVSQMRRASISVPSNVAEGQGRLARREFLHFLAFARGSLKELETQLLIARDLGYATAGRVDPCLALAEQVGRMLSALIRSIRKKVGS